MPGFLVTNAQPIPQDATNGPGFTSPKGSRLKMLLTPINDGSSASGSLDDEDNSWHVAGAIVLVALVAVAAGLVNVKITAGKD